jgi:hypothetical protein
MGMNTTNQIPEQVFTAKEIARLRIYRAAVAAGFYTDNLPPANGDALASQNCVYVAHGQHGEILVFIVGDAGQPPVKEELA